MATYVSPTDSRGYYTSLVINEVSRDITNNTTFIYYEYRLHSGPHNYFQSFGSTINLTIDGVTLLNTTTQSVSFSSPFYNTSVLLSNGNRTISHNADGTRSISFSSSFRTNSTTTFTPIPTHTISGSQALTTIPRASQPTLNVSSQALGSAITISTNRVSASFTHILKYAFGSEQGTIATGVGDSTSWTLPNTLANAIPNAQSGSGTITCETYNGSTLIGTRTVAFTATVPNNATFQPNASISSITEGQSGLSAFSVFIQNISRLRVQSSASGNFGATISQRRVTIDGGHLFGADVTFNPINKNGTLTVTLLVTDSRGHSRTVTQNVTLVAYFAPKINSFSASRSPTDQDTNLSAPINFEIAPVSNQNSRYYRLRYRVTGGSWVVLFDSTSYYSRTFTHTGSGVLDGNNSYEIELLVQDSFATITQTVTITTAFDLINFNSSGKGMAFGKVSENPDGLEIAMPTDFSEAPTVNDVPLVTASNHSHNDIIVQDIRTLEDLDDFFELTPSDLAARKVSAHFGRMSELSSMWRSLLSVKGWGDNAFAVWQLIGNSNNTVNDELYYRTGATTTWNTLRRLWHDGNSSPIIETGSNANGSYVKFADGTMIAWSEASITTTSTTALENGGFRSATTVLSLPVTFHAAPRVVASSRNSTRDVGLYAESTNVSTLSIIFKTISSDSTSRVHIAHWIAIGRWKA